MKKDELIGSVEAAGILKISRDKFNRWVVAGRIPVAIQAPGRTGPRLFNRAAIVDLARKNKGTGKK